MLKIVVVLEIDSNMNMFVTINAQNLQELKILQVINAYLINAILILIILIYALKIFQKVIILIQVMDIMKNVQKTKILEDVNLTQN